MTRPVLLGEPGPSPICHLCGDPIEITPDDCGHGPEHPVCHAVDMRHEYAAAIQADHDAMLARFRAAGTDGTISLPEGPETGGRTAR